MSQYVMWARTFWGRVGGRKCIFLSAGLSDSAMMINLLHSDLPHDCLSKLLTLFHDMMTSLLYPDSPRYYLSKLLAVFHIDRFVPPFQIWTGKNKVILGGADGTDTSESIDYFGQCSVLLGCGIHTGIGRGPGILVPSFKST